MKILIVEDEAALARTLQTVLQGAGYETCVCPDAEQAYDALQQQKVELILLDRMLPTMDGVSLAKLLRGQGVQTPILFLTALGEVEQRIAGLDAGGDDYLTKPFHNGELLARVRALIRRYDHGARQYIVGNVTFDEAAMLLTGPGGSTAVTGKLCTLAELMFSRAGQVVTRREIFAEVWGLGAEAEEAVIDNYIYFLRRVLRKVEADVQVLTVHGTGYRLVAS